MGRPKKYIEEIQLISSGEEEIAKPKRKRQTQKKKQTPAVDQTVEQLPQEAMVEKPAEVEETTAKAVQPAILQPQQTEPEKKTRKRTKPQIPRSLKPPRDSAGNRIKSENELRHELELEYKAKQMEARLRREYEQKFELEQYQRPQQTSRIYAPPKPKKRYREEYADDSDSSEYFDIDKSPPRKPRTGRKYASHSLQGGSYYESDEEESKGRLQTMIFPGRSF